MKRFFLKKMNDTEEEKKSEEETKEKGLEQESREKIRQQIEFYFSDANLSKDRFLKQEINSSEDGCRFVFELHNKFYKIIKI